MSSSNSNEPRYQSQEDQFDEYEENEKAEFEAFKVKKLKDAGIPVPVSVLSDAVHPKTQASYDKLNIPVQDTIRYATQRPNEILKHNIESMTEKPVKVNIMTRKIFRLKDSKGKEWLVWNYDEFFNDLNGNTKSLSYSKGAHEEVQGERRRNTQLEVTGSQITKRLQIYDTPFTKKKLEEILKKSANSVNTTTITSTEEEINNDSTAIEFLVGYTSRHTRNVYTNEHPIFSIKNQQDFIEGSWEQLWEMGQRAISNIKDLSRPISEDSNNSLLKRERFSSLTAPSTFAQGSYR